MLFLNNNISREKFKIKYTFYFFTLFEKKILSKVHIHVEMLSTFTNNEYYFEKRETFNSLSEPVRAFQMFTQIIFFEQQSQKKDENDCSLQKRNKISVTKGCMCVLKRRNETPSTKFHIFKNVSRSM